MSTLRTFIVEDNPVILNNLIATLEELSDVRVVGSVGSEREAVSELQQREGQVDLVIVDVFLTSGSGLGVLRSTQEMKLPASRVVLSNYATPDMRRRCLDLGADRVFDKSSELEELIAYCDDKAAESCGADEPRWLALSLAGRGGASRYQVIRFPRATKAWPKARSP